MILESRRQEEMREDQSKRAAKERLMQANLQSEERVEQKRFIRRLQDEEYGKHIEETLLMVGLIISIIHQLHPKTDTCPHC